MTLAKPTIGPFLSPVERNELGHLDYLVARLAELRDRGLITAESYQTILGESQGRRQAIGRDGEYRAAMGRANSFSISQSREALDWAEKAREIDPAAPRGVGASGVGSVGPGRGSRGHRGV